MRVDKIVLKNFMCYKALEVDLGDFNVVVGRNAAGKSAAFRDALQFVILGKAKGLKKKKDAAALSTGAAGNMSVTLETELGPITRNASGSCSVPATELSRLMGGLSADAAACCLNVWHFLDMDLEGRLAVLTELGGGNAVAEIKAMLLKELPELGANSLAEQAGADRGIAEKFSVERRREFKRQLAELSVPAKPEDTELDVLGRVAVLSKVDREKLAGNLKKCGKERAEVQAVAGGAVLFEDRKTLEEKLRLNKESRAKRADAIKARLEKITFELTLLDTVRKELEGVNAEIDHLEGESRGAQAERAGHLALKAALEERLEKLDKAKAECPLCARPMTTEERRAVIKGVVAEIKEAAGKVEAIDAGIRERLTKRSELHARRDQIGNELAKAGVLEQEREQLMAEKAGHGGELAALATEAKDIADDLAVLDKSAGAAKELEELEAREKALTDLLQMADAWHVAAAEHDKAVILEKTLKLNIDKWDRICGLLGDDGPVAKLMAAGWDKAAFLANAALLMPGKAVTIEVDGSVTLDTLPIEVASESERFRVACLCANVIAPHTGLLVIDGADILQAEAKESFSKWVSNLDGYQNVVVIATGEPKKLVPAAGDDDIVIVRDGTAEIVE